LDVIVEEASFELVEPSKDPLVQGIAIRGLRGSRGQSLTLESAAHQGVWV
jgi:hypothetical protein